MQFNIDEIFEIAEQIERNGAKFYRRAAEHITDGAQQQMLGDLARMEDEHERVFAELRERMAQGVRRDSVYEGDPTVEQYLWAWADRSVFDTSVDPLAVLTPGITIEEILKVAITREKESVVFYEGLKAGVPLGEDQARIQAIIAEELNHVALLAQQLRRVRGEA